MLLHSKQKEEKKRPGEDQIQFIATGQRFALNYFLIVALRRHRCVCVCARICICFTVALNFNF